MQRRRQQNRRIERRRRWRLGTRRVRFPDWAAVRFRTKADVLRVQMHAVEFEAGYRSARVGLGGAAAVDGAKGAARCLASFELLLQLQQQV